MDIWQLLLGFAALSGFGPAGGGGGGGVGPIGSLAARPPQKGGKAGGDSGGGSSLVGALGNEARSKYEAELRELRQQIEHERELREAAEREVELHDLRESLAQEHAQRQAAQARAARVVEAGRREVGVAAANTSQASQALQDAGARAEPSAGSAVATNASGGSSDGAGRPRQREQLQRNDTASVSASANQTLGGSQGLAASEPRPRQRQRQWRLLNATDVISAPANQTAGNGKAYAEIEPRKLQAVDAMPESASLAVSASTRSEAGGKDAAEAAQRQQLLQIAANGTNRALGHDAAALAAVAKDEAGRVTERHTQLTLNSATAALAAAIHDAVARIRERDAEEPQKQPELGSSERRAADTENYRDVEQRLAATMDEVMDRTLHPFKAVDSDEPMLKDLRPEFRPGGFYRDLYVEIAVALEQCWRGHLSSYDEATQSLLEAKEYLKAMDESGFANLFEGFPEKNKEASRKVEQFLAQKMMELEWLANGGNTMRSEAKEKALDKCKEDIRAAKLKSMSQDSSPTSGTESSIH